MHKFKMLINAKDFDEVRVAIVNEDGVLEQVDFESIDDKRHCLGNIYKGTITAIEPSLQASFVEYGGNRHGFLPLNEIHNRYFLSHDRKTPLEEKVKVGLEVLVQVAREEIGMKGAYLTTFLSIAGRYLVMMPHSQRVGISRKIENQSERSALRKVVEQITVPEDMGYIIRTAGMGKSREQVQRDLNVLISTWRSIVKHAEKVPSGTLLYREDNVVNRTIRDYFSEDIHEILIDERSAYEEMKAYFKKLMPNYANIVKFYRGKAPIFSKYQLEDQIERIFAPKIKLPSGGSIVVEQTEALVVIDVNSGKTSEGNLEQTAFKTNLEAADEAARQLRLRDMGGLVVIDFIDLRDRRNIHEVEKRLREAIKVDKARITMTGMSRFGLLEMSRQRIKTSKDIKHYEDCPTCVGLGRVKTLETQAIDTLRRIKAAISGSRVRCVTATCSEDLGMHIANTRRAELMDLENRYKAEVKIAVKLGTHVTPRFDIIKGKREERDKMPMPAPLSLASMAASMSEEDLNESKDYREEKLAELEKLSYEEVRGIDIPTPQKLSPYEQFNFSMRVLMMKRHGLYEERLDEFKDAVKEKIMAKKGGRKPKPKQDSSEEEE